MVTFQSESNRRFDYSGQCGLGGGGAKATAASGGTDGGQQWAGRVKRILNKLKLATALEVARHSLEKSRAIRVRAIFWLTGFQCLFASFPETIDINPSYSASHFLF